MNLSATKLIKNKIFQFTAAFVVFFVVTMPFRHWFSFVNVTEIRPAAAVVPFFGMLFGISGALGCAVSNFLADILSGYGLGMSIASLPVQFLMGFIPYFLWYNIPINGEKRAGMPRMTNASYVIKYVLIILLNSVITAFLLGCILKLFGIADIYSNITITMFWNNFDFGCIFNMPMFAVIAKCRKKSFSLNERMVIQFLLLAAIVSLIIGASTWYEMNRVSDDLMNIWDSVYTHVAIAFNVFLLIEIIFMIYMERYITTPIQQLSDIGRNYVKGDGENLDSNAFIDVCERYRNYKTEVGSLAKSYSHMVKELDRYVENIKAVTAEKERISTELNVAAQIQADMLPSIFPPFPERNEFEIYATMTPAKEVGGDFYDFFFIDNDHLALVMADVSGKGVPASLFMVISKTLIKNRAQMGEYSPARILTDVNNQLCQGNKSMHFVTVWLAVLEISTGKGMAVNAGHEHPVFKHRNGKFELVKYRHSMVMGAMDGLNYKEREFHLEQGDRLFVYTDGVPEAMDRNDEMFGTDRMLEALNRDPNVTNEQLLKNVRSSVDKFVGAAPQFDDLTMLGFTYYGRKDQENAGD